MDRDAALRTIGKVRARYPTDGELYQLHQWIAALDAEDAAADPDGCARCGRPLTQPPRGRPRKWCSETCRGKARRE